MSSFIACLTLSYRIIIITFGLLEHLIVAVTTAASSEEQLLSVFYVNSDSSCWRMSTVCSTVMPVHLLWCRQPWIV